MSQVDYGTPQILSHQQGNNSKESFLMRAVLRIGFVKDKKQANIILLIVAGVFFLATFVILFANGIFSSGGNTSDKNYDNSPEDYMNNEYREEEIMNNGE